MYVEEMTKDENGKQLYLELRIDGPYHAPIGTSRENQLYIEVNVLCVAAYDPEDSLALIKLTDVATWMLNQDICVYKYGEAAGDDKSYFETLRLLGSNDAVKVSNFGQIDPVNKIFQATVEAHYELRYVNNGTV
jgi:hypothetical protein